MKKLWDLNDEIILWKVVKSLDVCILEKKRMRGDIRKVYKCWKDYCENVVIENV